MAYSEEEHLHGLLLLIDPSEKARAKRLLATAKGRAKWLDRLAHNVEMNPDHVIPAKKGQRDSASVLANVRQLTTERDCYVVSAESELDGTFQALDRMILEGPILFDHGTILSIVPGRLAVFKPAAPGAEEIVRRV